MHDVSPPSTDVASALEPPESTGPRSGDRSFSASIFALGVGGFAIGTGEFVIMGLLPEVAADLHVTIPQAGHVISAYALGVVIGAPVLAVLAADWSRRTLLVALMALFALGNLGSALAPGYGWLNLLRFVTGLPHGTYFGVAALVAASLAPPHRRASAVGLVMLGLTTATLVGVPIAAWLGQHLGWRAAFLFVGALAALACVLIWRQVPPLPASHGASPLRELGALARPQVWLTLGIGAIGFGGLFSVFSYIKPMLTEVTGLSVDTVPLVLGLFGLGMVAGNLVGSRLADRSLMGTIAGVLVWDALVLGAIVFTAPHPVLVSINVFLVGTIVAIGPALQIRLMDVAGDAQTLAAALNHSAFNIANALGAWLGGVAIAAGLGWTSTGWVGSLLALGGMVVFGAAVWQARQARRRGQLWVEPPSVDSASRQW
jgi:DHA1 family inner membrane transport protein